MIFEVPEPQKSYPCVHRDTIFTFSRFREQIEKVVKNEVQKGVGRIKFRRNTDRLQKHHFFEILEKYGLQSYKPAKLPDHALRQSRQKAVPDPPESPKS